MKKFTVNLKIWAYICLCVVFFAFDPGDLLNEQAIFIQKMLLEHYDQVQESPDIQRSEINVTNTGFCRYKRFFESGKIEYFSFNVLKFKDLEYQGNSAQGKLVLHTFQDDVIVQTYNDKHGDLDSMASSLTIPLKNIEPEDLAGFSKALTVMHAGLKK